MTFNDDKTVTMSGGAAGKTESASGTYTLEENKLTIKMTSPSGSPDQTFTLSEDKKSFEMPIIGKMVKQ